MQVMTYRPKIVKCWQAKLRNMGGVGGSQCTCIYPIMHWILSTNEMKMCMFILLDIGKLKLQLKLEAFS